MRPIVAPAVVGANVAESDPEIGRASQDFLVWPGDGVPAAPDAAYRVVELGERVVGPYGAERVRVATGRNGRCQPPRQVTVARTK
jgi:hypothetical protein